jgi:hypothetical protein
VLQRHMAVAEQQSAEVELLQRHVLVLDLKSARVGYVLEETVGLPVVPLDRNSAGRHCDILHSQGSRRDIVPRPLSSNPL